MPARKIAAVGVLGFCLVFCVGIGAGLAWGLHIVTTPSVPVGVYRVTHESLTRGRFVVICLPAAIARFGMQRGYVQRGSCGDGTRPAIKTIGAVAGDRVEIQRSGVSVNGQAFAQSAVLSVDRQGRMLPHVGFGHYRVARGEVWVFSFCVSNSWDSRYYGPVQERDVVSTARAVWTWQ